GAIGVRHKERARLVPPRGGPGSASLAHEHELGAIGRVVRFAVASSALTRRAHRVVEGTTSQAGQARAVHADRHDPFEPVAVHGAKEPRSVRRPRAAGQWGVRLPGWEHPEAEPVGVDDRSALWRRPIFQYGEEEFAPVGRPDRTYRAGPALRDGKILLAGPVGVGDDGAQVRALVVGGPAHPIKGDPLCLGAGGGCRSGPTSARRARDEQERSRRNHQWHATKYRSHGSGYRYAGSGVLRAGGERGYWLSTHD